jgi:4-hydroxythreonine-4-phosphate dehydrogenase
MSSVVNNTSKPLALTMGDPAGIGPDITLQAWCERDAAGLPAFIVLGDPDIFSCRARDLGLEVVIEEVGDLDAANACFKDALPIYPLRLPREVEPGKPESVSASVIIEAIDMGVELAQTGKASALVTNPINKKLLFEAGFSHPGHTEYLAELCRENGKIPRPVMLLTSGKLRVVPVTVHIPLKDVPAALTEDLIIETVEITARDLRNIFQIPSPRIGITGLNPHAGEDGTLGLEEIETISPAIEKLKKRGLDVIGPMPADAVFQDRLRGTFDVLIAMYHDQALIPVKTLSFDSTVNMTLGLPIIRTSPDHGTAYELAGTGKANPGSLVESLRLAERLSSRTLALT